MRRRPRVQYCHEHRYGGRRQGRFQEARGRVEACRRVPTDRRLRPVLRWRGGVIAHAPGMRLAGQLREAVRRACSTRAPLRHPPGAGACDGRHPVVRLAGMHLAGLGPQRRLLLPPQGGLRAVRTLRNRRFDAAGASLGRRRLGGGRSVSERNPSNLRSDRSDVAWIGLVDQSPGAISPESGKVGGAETSAFRHAKLAACSRASKLAARRGRKG